jgi:DNA primase
MPRTKTKAKATLERIKSLPWAAALQAGMVLRSRWKALSQRDRDRLIRMMRDSKGRLSNLSGRERDELRRVVRKADLKGIGRDLFALRGGRRGRKHR